VSAATVADKTPPFTVLLPAVNQMIEVMTTRIAMTTFHPPAAVYAMICVLAVISSVFVGYGMAEHKVRSVIHSRVRSGHERVLCVILNLEYPALD